MAKKPNISEVKTTRELFSLMPPENAGLLIAEMHTQAKQAVLREIAATHQTVKLPVDRIVPFDDNPYQVLDNEEMDELVQSIKERGILSPLIVLPKPDDAHTFELISGHRRLFAAKKAGLKKVPAVVCNVSRDEAAIMVVDSNLHREHILPSEKAKAYKLRLDAMKQQGKRVDLTSSQVGTKLRADEELAEIMYELGCIQAYNLDGGNTAEMLMTGSDSANPMIHLKGDQESSKYRTHSDIIYFATAVPEGERE